MHSILACAPPDKPIKKKYKTFIVSIIMRKMINREYRKNIIIANNRNKNVNSVIRKLDYLDFKPSKFKEKLLLLSGFKKG
jgi:hypothetical protein